MNILSALRAEMYNIKKDFEAITSVSKSTNPQCFCLRQNLFIFHLFGPIVQNAHGDPHTRFLVTYIVVVTPRQTEGEHEFNVVGRLPTLCILLELTLLFTSHSPWSQLLRVHIVPDARRIYADRYFINWSDCLSCPAVSTKTTYLLIKIFARVVLDFDECYSWYLLKLKIDIGKRYVNL